MTEHQLIEQCILYDRRAQQMVYEKYSRAMYTSAYHITGDFELAGEVLQDAVGGDEMVDNTDPDVSATITLYVAAGGKVTLELKHTEGDAAYATSPPIQLF